MLPSKTINYRGFTLDFYNEDQQVYTIWNSSKLELGMLNDQYEDDMKYVIDTKLDFITKLEVSGAELRYFNNSGYRDVKLVYKNRIVKVYPTAKGIEDPNSQYLPESVMNTIIDDANLVIKTVLYSK